MLADKSETLLFPLLGSKLFLHTNSVTKFVFIVAQHSYLNMWLQNKNTPIHGDHISAYPLFFRGWFNVDRVFS